MKSNHNTTNTTNITPKSIISQLNYEMQPNDHVNNILCDDDIVRVLQLLYSQVPTPDIELIYTSPYTLLIAVILSTQSTDKRVNIITEELFKIAKTPREMIALGEDGVKNYIKSVGFFNVKAKNIIATSQMILNEFNDKVPSTMEDLIKLPGVGRKCANVILNCIYDQATMPVDTHVFRVSRRIGLSDAKTVIGVENDLMNKIPRNMINDGHHLLVLHGRYVCKARKPICQKCVIRELCLYDKKSL